MFCSSRFPGRLNRGQAAVRYAVKPKTAALRAKLTALATLKHSPMHDLLTGRVRVGTGDEPARGGHIPCSRT
jgi:hypothetical protein